MAAAGPNQRLDLDMFCSELESLANVLRNINKSKTIIEDDKTDPEWEAEIIRALKMQEIALKQKMTNIKDHIERLEAILSPRPRRRM